MHPLTSDPLDGIQALFGEGFVTIDRESHPAGTFAVDAMNLTGKQLQAIEDNVIRISGRVGRCLDEHSRKKLPGALEQVWQLAKLVPGYREMGRPFTEISDNELGAVFQKGTEYHRSAMDWLLRLDRLPRALEHFRRCAREYVKEYIAPLEERTSSAYANAWYSFEVRRFLEDEAASDELGYYEGEEFLARRRWHQEEADRLYLPTAFGIRTSYTAMEHPRKEGESILAERVICQELETFLTLDLLRGFAAGHAPRRCEHCGRYFLLDSGYDIRYCENEAPDAPGKTCSQVGARAKSKRLDRDDPIRREYSIVYSRLKTRKHRGQLSDDEWNRKVAEIQELKDQAVRGDISLGELRSRLKGY